jgi:hypothetical protein
MSKKAYRPGSSATPQYPRLVEVGRRSVLDWGLVAVGSLWLGSAGCDRSPLVGAAEAKGNDTSTKPAKEMGLRGKVAISRLPDAGVADAKSPKAQVKEKSAATSPPTEPTLGRMRTAGRPPHPRLEPTTSQPEKKAEKSEKKAAKSGKSAK